MSGVHQASGVTSLIVVDESYFPVDLEVSDATILAKAEITIPDANESPLPEIPDVTSPAVNEEPLPESFDATSPAVNEASLPSGPAVSIPVIDVSLLYSTNPEDRAHAVRDLGKACEEIGFFVLVNHNIPLLAACDEFFNLPDEEKYKYETNEGKFPVKVSLNAGEKTDKDKTACCLRDYLRLYAHPEFHCPDKPEQFRALLRDLLGAISESLGLEQYYIEKTMNLDDASQLVVVNYYPPCPDPDPKSAMGIPPHTDHGLLTFVVQNGVGGFEIQHDGKWCLVNEIPGAIFVNTSNQLEILSNGKSKSVLHRAVVNTSQNRISMALPNGPSLDTVVAPAAPLISEDSPAKYKPMKYSEYINVIMATRPDNTAVWPDYEPSLIAPMRNKLIGEEKPKVSEI